MLLNEQFDEMREKFYASLPADKLEIFQSSLQQLNDSGITQNAKQSGDIAPDFSLANATGEPVTLSERLAKGPVVLTFYRGGWCPYCNLALRALQVCLPELEQKGGSLIAISPQTPDHSLSTIEKNELEFDVLSDTAGKVAKSYGVLFQLDDQMRSAYQQFGLDLSKFNGDDSFTLPIPSTYVISSDARIVYAYNEVDHTKRAEPADIMAILKQI